MEVYILEKKDINLEVFKKDYMFYSDDFSLNLRLYFIINVLENKKKQKLKKGFENIGTIGEEKIYANLSELYFFVHYKKEYWLSPDLLLNDLTGI